MFYSWYSCESAYKIYNTKGRTGYNACERCQVHGERSNNRQCYPNVDSEERTNETFRNRLHRNHNNGISPLFIFNDLDMVAMLVLDFMHHGCLGVMKKLLEICLAVASCEWGVKLNDFHKQLINYMLGLLKTQVPTDFQRKTQPIQLLGLWKVNQFYFFLLYAGIVVLKSVLSETLYNHFSCYFAHLDLCVRGNFPSVSIHMLNYT